MQVYGIIYKITSIAEPDKCYIGQTRGTFEERMCYYKKLNCKGQPKIFNALRKYGWDAFISEQIDEVYGDQETLDVVEDIYMDHYECIEKGYNCKRGGSHGKHSKETIKKISESKKKYFQEHPEILKLLSASRETPQARKNSSDAAKRRYKNDPDALKRLHASTQTQEARKNNSNAKKEFFKNNPEALKKLHASRGTVKARRNAREARRPLMKPCICVTVGQYFEQYFESVMDVERTTGFSNGNVSLNLQGKIKTTRGHVFRYATPEEIEAHKVKT